MSKKQMFKVIILGNRGAGKTMLVRRLFSGNFIDPGLPTIGTDFHIWPVSDPKVGPIQLQIWDVHEIPHSRSMIPNFFQGTRGVLLAFSIVDQKSLDDLPEWLNLVRQYAPNVPIVVVGTKDDIVAPRISRRDVEDFLRKNNLVDYCETSAKTGKNVIDTFLKITGRIVG